MPFSPWLPLIITSLTWPTLPRVPFSAPPRLQHWGRQLRGKPAPVGEFLPELAEVDASLEGLRSGYSRDYVLDWGSRRPGAVTARIWACARALLRVRDLWVAEAALPPEERTCGVVLRAELSNLGPFAVKIGQTLSQRPDIIPEELCAELKALQTQNEPFPTEIAHAVIARELGCRGQLLGSGATPLDY